MPLLGLNEEAWALSLLRRDKPASTEIEEAALLDLCEREGIGPLLYSLLAKAPEKDVPTQLLQSLKARYLHTYFRNEARLNELGRLIVLFQQERIPLLLLKGVALLASVYEDWGLRPFNDLDLLVPETDLERAHHLILQEGYQLTMREYRPGWRRFGGARGYWKNEVWLDLHWRLEYLPTHAAAHEPFSHTRPATLAGSEVLILQPEDLLYHQLHHMACHHGRFKLIWLVDISRIVAAGKEELDWKRVAEKGGGKRLPTPLRVGLKKARDLLGASVPEHILEGAPHLERLVLCMLRLDGEAEVAGKIFRLWSLPGINEKLRFVLGGLFPGSEFLQIRYHLRSKRFAWVYFLLRPFLATFKVVTQALSSLLQLFWSRRR
jgi:hypothetical protein